MRVHVDSGLALASVDCCITWQGTQAALEACQWTVSSDEHSHHVMGKGLSLCFSRIA